MANPILNDRQRKFAENRVAGMSMEKAALAAGFSPNGAQVAGSRLDNLPQVIAHKALLKQKIDNLPILPDPNSVVVASADHVVHDDPKEFLLSAMNNPAIPFLSRAEFAKALMPYYHAKLGETGKKEKKDKAAGDVAKKRFTPQEAPQLRVVS